MTIVHGQIESLTKIKAILSQKCIRRFNSIGDINKFKANYALEKEQIAQQITHDFSLCWCSSPTNCCHVKTAQLVPKI
jgi:hypothetical protein